jgi:hypothetical protein
MKRVRAYCIVITAMLLFPFLMWLPPFQLILPFTRGRSSPISCPPNQAADNQPADNMKTLKQIIKIAD